MTFTVLRLYNKLRFARNKKISTYGKPLISPWAEVQAQGMLNIGNGVKAERGVLLASRASASMHLGTKVYINRNTCIVAKKQITIGDNCIIAAGSVITHDVPCNSIVYQKRINTIVTRTAAIGK